jgi:hypothetical protein
MTGKAYHFEGTYSCGLCGYSGMRTGRTPEELAERLRAALDRHRARAHRQTPSDPPPGSGGSTPPRGLPAKAGERERT